tara:strand:- start:48 stop:569 length:522 start_codon:yes stop_codon:yes gene_type:complete
MQLGPTNRTVFQNAWVVSDLESACMKWVNQMGIGPFFVSNYEDAFTEVTYRNQPAELSMRVALAQAGPVQIELIEPLTQQCAYRDVVSAGQSGFHHMCVWSEDFEADQAYFEELGYVAANTGRSGITQFAYFDTRAFMGCMLELVTRHAAIETRFAEIAAAAVNWDGSDPIRA